MKFTRFKVQSSVLTGVLTEDCTIREIKGDLFGKWEYTGQTFSETDVNFLAPIAPNQIIGIGANYVSKTDELPSELPEIPVFFFKPTSSVIGPEEDIIIPGNIEQVKFESELAIVIGKEAKNVPEEEVLEYVFGYTVGNDVTAPQYFHQAGHWTIGKSFDTFTPLGPVIETELDPFNVIVEAKLNDVIKQNSPTNLMIIPIRKMISYLTGVMTLKPGDVILTGDPCRRRICGSRRCDRMRDQGDWETPQHVYCGQRTHPSLSESSMARWQICYNFLILTDEVRGFGKREYGEVRQPGTGYHYPGQFEKGGLGVTEIAKQIDINKSSVYRILSTLVLYGYIEQDKETGRYKLGYKFLEVSTKLLESIDLRGEAKPFLQELEDETNEVVHLVVFDQGEVVYIEKLDGNETLRMHSKVESVPRCIVHR